MSFFIDGFLDELVKIAGNPVVPMAPGATGAQSSRGPTTVKARPMNYDPAPKRVDYRPTPMKERRMDLTPAVTAPTQGSGRNPKKPKNTGIPWINPVQREGIRQNERGYNATQMANKALKSLGGGGRLTYNRTLFHSPEDRVRERGAMDSMSDTKWGNSRRRTHDPGHSMDMF